MRLQRVFDLARLDAIPPQLDHLVDPSEVAVLPVFAEHHPVTGRIGSGDRGLTIIAEHDRGPLNHQLTLTARGTGVPRLIRNPQAVIGGRRAYR